MPREFTPEQKARRAAYDKEYRKRNKEKMSEHNRRWREKNREKIDARNKSKERRFYVYQKNAKEKGRTFNLDEETFGALIDGPCFFCGESPAGGVDRFDNSVGYEVANCKSCCKWCNKAKNSGSFQTFVDKVRAIHALHGTVSNLCQ